VDPDLGGFDDDYVGGDSLLSLAYACNADNDDREYGEAPPSVGFRVIHGPRATPDGVDNDFDGVVDEPGERLAMTSFVQSGPWDANFASRAYGILQARRPTSFYDSLGAQVTYGGDSRDTTGTPTTFMYTGMPPHFWSELDIGGGVATHPADRQFILSSGPFTLEPGEEDELYFAVLYARGTDHLDSVRLLKEAAARVDGLTPEQIVPTGHLIQAPTGRPILVSALHTFATGETSFAGVTGISGFLTVANAQGAVLTGAAADFRGFPGPMRPGPEQQVGEGRWMIHSAGNGTRTTFDDFVEHSLPDWSILPDDIELRFTGTSINYDLFGDVGGGVQPEDLPFEAWNIGEDSPEDPSDDFLLIVVGHDPEADGWGLRAVDHEASGGEDDPQTDPFSLYRPVNQQPGDIGYREWESLALAGVDPQTATDRLLLEDLVFFNWNGGDVGTGVYDQEMPERGTVFRITTERVSPPIASAPADGATRKPGLVDFHWRWMRDDEALLSISGPQTEILETRRSGFTADLQHEGVYTWTVRDGAGQLSEVGTFSIDATAVETAEASPQVEFALEPTYPNPFLR
jgi:hypothetical protein